MSRTSHVIYIGILSSVVIIASVLISHYGLSYYFTQLQERYFHSLHILLKPSGNLGHGYGVIGSLFMIFGMSSYMARKRFKFMSRWGILKHWLEFHIFLCVLGPILILFHTSFKFGGIVAVSFWSMVVVFLSGIIGRYIYIQIPHTIEGRALSLEEVKNTQMNLRKELVETYQFDDKIALKIEYYFEQKEFKKLRSLLNTYQNKNSSKQLTKQMHKLIRNEMVLQSRINRLDYMQRIFKYWHVIHMPFALVMLIIMFIHIVITIIFGYQWIF